MESSNVQNNATNIPTINTTDNNADNPLLDITGNNAPSSVQSDNTFIIPSSSPTIMPAPSPNTLLGAFETTDTTADSDEDEAEIQARLDKIRDEIKNMKENQVLDDIDYNITKGFTNFGNTCFYNATLQSIFRCELLMESLKKYQGDHPLLKKLRITIEDYYLKPRVSTVGPTLLLRSYKEMNQNYQMWSQEDARECLTYFLDNFDEATKSEGLNISEYFDCHIMSQTKCPNSHCNNVIESNANEKVIMLPISGLNNFSEAFSKFLEPEILSDDNKWYCDKCKEKVKASTRLIIKGTPKYLYIALKRFEHEYIKEQNKIKTTKITNDVNMPDMIQINGENYELRGDIHHFGGLNGGHYIYFHKINDKWVAFNDDSIQSNINEENINTIKNNGYVYMFRRVD